MSEEEFLSKLKRLSEEGENLIIDLHILLVKLAVLSVLREEVEETKKRVIVRNASQEDLERIYALLSELTLAVIFHLISLCFHFKDAVLERSEVSS